MNCAPWIAVFFLTLIIAAPTTAAETACTGLKLGEVTVLQLTPNAVYVIDGDTIRERFNCQTELRLSDVDAPELKPEKKRKYCVAEKDFALKASMRLTELIRKAKSLQFESSGRIGGYNRALGKLIIDGNSAGQILRNEGLGCMNTQEIKHDWCVSPPKCEAGPKHPN